VGVIAWVLYNSWKDCPRIELLTVSSKIWIIAGIINYGECVFKEKRCILTKH
jgi:hypothetical protein